jgi:hypothetical protein
MSTPDSKCVRIRLSIDVPSGTAGGPIEVASFRSMAEGQGNENTARYTSPKPPVDGMACIRPMAGSQLGEFEFRCKYVAPFPHAVAAVAYPAAIYPGFTIFSPAPSGITEGRSTDGGMTWLWNDTHGNRVRGGDHSSVGISNTISVWVKFGPGLSWVFDGAHSFKGVTEGTGACSGSGSGGIEETLIPKELDSAKTLRMTIPDGPRKGQYLAKQSSQRTWRMTVAKATWEIKARTPRRMVIRMPKKKVASFKIDTSPFAAYFPGSDFESRRPVVVTTR